MLELFNIFAGYSKENYVLKGVNLTLYENEVIGIIGQNGSGKSTLAKTIMNLVPYRTGEILFNGKIISENSPDVIARNGIGFFIQGGRIFPNLTIEENLNIAVGRFNKDEKIKRIRDLADVFNFFNNRKLNITASYLSGGEQHQLALAMILINKPQILILDEPSAGLSPVNAKLLFKALNNFRQKNRTAILLIEQNVIMAFENSDQIKFLENGNFKMEGIVTKEFEKRITDNIFNKIGELK